MTTQMDTAAEQADVHEEIQLGDLSTNVEAPAVEETPAFEETAAKALNAVLIRAAVANRNADRFNAADTAAKADVVKVLGRKGSLPVMNPLNPSEEFVQITVSKLTYIAKAEDPSATKEWVKEKYADKVEKRKHLTTKYPAHVVIEILEKLAPFLLEEEEVVPDHVINELLMKSKRARRPIGFGGEAGKDAPPGIVVEESTPRVTVTFRNANVIDDLLVTGYVDMDGNLLGGAE